MNVTGVEGRPQSRPPLFIRAPWQASVSIALLALAWSLVSLANGFVYDDLSIIVRDPRIHQIAAPWRFFLQPYWGPPAAPGLYRPAASLSFALQWVMGDGSALAFHVVNVLLYVLVCLAVFRMATALVGPAAGWWAGALFAVHPVHVETVAPGVGQSELWAALLVVTAMSCYIRARRRGDLAARDILLIAGLYLAGCMFKENAIMLPALLVLAEVTVAGGTVGSAAGRRDLRRLWWTLAAVAVGFWAVHAAVIGNISGDRPSVAFWGMDIRDRFFTMLGVVPEWFRLLLLPAKLKLEYVPREIHLAHTFGARQLAGAVLAAGSATAALFLARRLPAFTFGLFWTALALFPVSNVLIPSGIVLAERTLFLPSVGAVLALGALAAWASPLAGRWPAGARQAALAAGAAVLIAGAVRSAARLPAWRSIKSFHEQLLLETPNSYRTHWVRGLERFAAGDRDGGSRELATALVLFPNDPQLLAQIADRERGSNRCDAAIELYRRSLLIDRTKFYLRERLTRCLIKLGRLDEARAEVRHALANRERGARQDSLLVEQAAERQDHGAGAVDERDES